MVARGESSVTRKRQNDPRRFIETLHATEDGEATEKSAGYIDQSVIDDKEQYDGFYAI